MDYTAELLKRIDDLTENFETLRRDHNAMVVNAVRLLSAQQRHLETLYGELCDRVIVIECRQDQQSEHVTREAFETLRRDHNGLVTELDAIRNAIGWQIENVQSDLSRTAENLSNQIERIQRY